MRCTLLLTASLVTWLVAACGGIAPSQSATPASYLSSPPRGTSAASPRSTMPHSPLSTPRKGPTPPRFTSLRPVISPTSLFAARTPPPKPRTATPTPFPTWPVTLPPLATPTPVPARLTAADLLPRGAELLADAVADVGPGGAPAVVLLYRWPLGLVIPHLVIERGTIRPRSGSHVFGSTDVHLRVVPLAGSTYTPQGTSAHSPVLLRTADVNRDGLRDALILPRRQSSTLFDRSPLTSWPRILSAAEIPFQGGYLALPVSGWPFFKTQRPVLYYAGPKEGGLTDVDGDGLTEVEVAYSTEDGADTWQVDRYRWDGQAYVHTETFTRPAAEPIPPNRYQAMIRALEPLPEFQPLGKAQLPVQKVEVQAQQAVTLDVDGDGRLETLLAFLVTPLYGEGFRDRLIGGQMGLALFDAQGHLLWRSPLERLALLTTLEVSVVPVSLAPGEKGVLAHWFGIGEGTGRAWVGHVRLYRWHERQFEEVWDWKPVGGMNLGYGYHWRESDLIRMTDVDHDGRLEVLVEFTRSTLEIGSAPWTANYLLRLPGALAFRWDGHAYRPAYFVAEGHTASIRPNLPLVFTPRLSQSLTIDGRTWDWMQVEYLRSVAVRGRTGWPYNSSPLAWDERTLYLQAHMFPGETLTLALDTDLAGDFDDPALSADDVVLEVALSSQPGCRGPLTIRFRHPAREPEGIQAAVQPSGLGGNCSLELAVPFEVLDVDGRALVPTPGWVAGEKEPTGFREYRPRVGAVMGFAVEVNRPTPSSPYRVDDPTTWNTLVFIADR